MNRRDLLKYTLAAPVVGIALKTRYDHYIERRQSKPEKKGHLAPYDTDDRIYDDWLESGKDEMHL